MKKTRSRAVFRKTAQTARNRAGVETLHNVDLDFKDISDDELDYEGEEDNVVYEIGKRTGRML